MRAIATKRRGGKCAAARRPFADPFRGTRRPQTCLRGRALPRSITFQTAPDRNGQDAGGPRLERAYPVVDVRQRVRERADRRAGHRVARRTQKCQRLDEGDSARATSVSPHSFRRREGGPDVETLRTTHPNTHPCAASAEGSGAGTATEETRDSEGLLHLAVRRGRWTPLAAKTASRANARGALNTHKSSRSSRHHRSRSSRNSPRPSPITQLRRQESLPIASSTTRNLEWSAQRRRGRGPISSRRCRSAWDRSAEGSSFALRGIASHSVHSRSVLSLANRRRFWNSSANSRPFAASSRPARTFVSKPSCPSPLRFLRNCSTMPTPLQIGAVAARRPVGGSAAPLFRKAAPRGLVARR